MTGKEVSTIVSAEDAGSALLASLNQGVNPWADMLKDLGDFFGAFMKLSGQTGEITYKDGEKEIDIETPARFWVNVPSMTYGYNCWVGGERVDSESDLWVNKHTLKSKKELADHGPYDEEENEGWQEFYGLHLIHENEDGEDVKLSYNAASGSAKRAVRMFMKSYAEQVRQQMTEGGELPVPCIEITVTKFKTKAKKIIFPPNFEIVNWADASEFAEDFAMGQDDDDNYEEDDRTEASGSGEDDSSNYDQNENDDVTDIDPDTGEPVDESKGEKEAEKPAEKPKGRGRGGRASTKAKSTSKHEGPQDEAPKEKPKASRGRGRGRGKAK